MKSIDRNNKTDKELEKSLSILKATLDSTTDGILVVDKKGNIESFNNKFLEMWKIPESIIKQMDDKKTLDFVLNQLKNPKAFLNKVMELYNKLDEESFDILEFDDGRTFERYSKPQRIGEKIEGRVWSFRDITERKRAELALIESEQRHRALVEHAYDLICETDIVGRFLYVSPNHKEQLGYETEELEGKSIFEFVHKDDINETTKEFTKTIQTLASGHAICRFKHKNGEWRWLECAGKPFKTATNEIRLVIVSRDITKRKIAEEALKDSINQLSKKNRYETILSTVTRSIHKSINLQDVLENTVEALSKNIGGVESVAVYLVEGKYVVLKAHRRLPKWFTKQLDKIPYPKGFIWKTIIDAKPIYIPVVDKDSIIGPAGRKLGTKSYLSMPINYKGKVVGAIGINSFKKNVFDEEELKLLKIVAEQIETAFDNALQTEALREALAEVERLKNRLETENIYLQEEIRNEYNFEEILGRSEEINKVLQMVEQVAHTDSAVLIIGETGTGKELIARAIHNISSRKDRPLVKVNCGAISAGLVESELFGHEKGSFTGAIQKRIGRFELAHGGTIFLDEVGELPLDTQVKLLRVLQDGEFERVGGSRTFKSDVRVIAATNRDIKKAIEDSTFRSDLYFRLNVIELKVPPLRERKGDIELMTKYFVVKYSKKHGKIIDSIPDETMDLLKSYNWPGNVRELENTIERAMILSKETKLTVDNIPNMKQNNIVVNLSSKSLEEAERFHITQVLKETNWVIYGKFGAATLLNINPNTLRSRMRKLGIRKP